MKPVLSRASLPWSGLGSFPEVFRKIEYPKKLDAVGVFLISVLLYNHHLTGLCNHKLTDVRRAEENDLICVLFIHKAASPSCSSILDTFFR